MSDIRHPEKINRVSNPIPKKPPWIRVKAPTSKFFKSTNKIIKDNKDINESYLIIKGEGGRDYLENEIKGFAEEINVISVYKRVPIKDFLSESCVSNSANNYLIVSSKTALIELISSVSNYKKNASLVLIVPNERIINGIDKKIFRDIIIICNSSSAETYINTIVKHNEQN